jgi:hypothetical protein
MAGYGNQSLTPEQLVDLVENIESRRGNPQHELETIGMTKEQIDLALSIIARARADACVAFRVSRFAPHLGGRETRHPLYRAELARREPPERSQANSGDGKQMWSILLLCLFIAAFVAGGFCLMVQLVPTGSSGAAWRPLLRVGNASAEGVKSVTTALRASGVLWLVLAYAALRMWRGRRQ